MREVAGGERRIPPVSIWHGTADSRVVLHNWQELIEQWTAVHDVSTKPVRGERNGPVTRNFYIDRAGSVRVEGVLVEGLAHAFPIRVGGELSCGQPGDFVVAGEVCAATEIARFWGLSAD